MFDTHAIARSLTDAGIDPGHADALTDAIRQAAEHDVAREPLATKVDIAELRTELAGQIAEQRAEVAEVRTEIANLDTRLSTQIADVRTEIASMETRLIRWMVGTVLTTAALTFGILRFIAE